MTHPPESPATPQEAADESVAAVVGRTLRLLIAVILVTILIVMFLHGSNLI